MKKIIAATVIALTSLSAQASDICVSGYDLVIRIGKSRDAGVPMQSLMKEAEEFSIVQLREPIRSLIEEVYMRPEIPITRQAAEFYKGCKEPSKPKAGTNRGAV